MRYVSQARSFNFVVDQLYSSQLGKAVQVNEAGIRDPSIVDAKIREIVQCPYMGHSNVSDTVALQHDPFQTRKTTQVTQVCID